MEQFKQQEVNIIKPRRALFLGFSFSALLFLGLLFLIFNAFVIVPKWISLPAFIGFLKKSERFPSNTTNAPEQSTHRTQTLSTSDSSSQTKILNSSPDEERNNFSSFPDMGNIPIEGESIPPQENDVFEQVHVPVPSPLATVDDTAMDSASPPMSRLEPLKQINDLGNVRNPKRHFVMDLAPPPKSNKRTTFCNIFDGKWVFDSSFPHYRSGSCSFIDEAFDCEGNGRPDLDFMKWRWQPRDCDLPRFNATDMLERLRGKRLVFVGDSINRNQWESMLCLLSETVPDKSRVYETHHRKITKGKGFYTFMFKDYHCTIEFYATHFLVQEGKARIGRKRRPTLRIDKIDKTSSKWKGADILIFNTGHWWTHSKIAEGENYYQEGDKVQPHLDVLTALRRALITWASWVETHVESRKTQVFFRSYSPSHFWLTLHFFLIMLAESVFLLRVCIL